MGWLPILTACISALIFYLSKASSSLVIISVFVLIVCFWSLGIMHNFAVEAAKKRRVYSGKFYDIEPVEAHSTPNWLAGINLIASIASFILFILSLFYLFR